MTDLARPVLTGLEVADFNVRLQAGDLDDATARRRARGEAGASISWILGHLLCQRCYLLAACGEETENPYESRFSFRAPATDGADYPPIADLRSDWIDLHGRLVHRVRGLSVEALLAESTLPNPTGDASLLSALAFFVWHEAYHVGTIGLLRVQWGLRHTHELALEASGLDLPDHPAS